MFDLSIYFTFGSVLSLLTGITGVDGGSILTDCYYYWNLYQGYRLTKSFYTLQLLKPVVQYHT